MTAIDWELLGSYVRGSCTPAERQWVERLLVAHPEVGDALAAIRDVAADGDTALTTDRLHERLAAVKCAGLSAPPHHRSTPRFSTPHPARPTARLAAGIALAALGAGGGWLALRHSAAAPLAPAASQYSVISTAPGQRLGLRLSDGTTVMLAPASRLRTPASYGTNARVVELEGAAVFTVAHDAGRPFAVHTTNAVASDLGTRFLVRAYAGDSATEVVVAEGAVAVRAAGRRTAGLAADSLIVGRAERVRVAADGRLDHARDVPLEEYFGWTEGRLVFRDEPLRDVARQLGRWYGIDVRLVPAAIGQRRLRATIVNEPATVALQMIAASLDLRLSRADRVFTLFANH